MSDSISDFNVTDRITFKTFIELLRQDFLKNGEHWENNTLDTFLHAISTYAQDIQGYYDNTKQNINADEPSWQIFADIFKGAKGYE